MCDSVCVFPTAFTIPTEEDKQYNDTNKVERETKVMDERVGNRLIE